MKRILSSILLVCVCILGLTSSCERRIGLASWELGITAPLVQGSLDLGDLVQSDILSSDNSGLLHIRVQDTLIRLGLDTLIGIPDTTLTSEFTIPIGGIPWPPGVPFYSDTIQTTFDLDEVELTFAEVRSSLFDVALENDLKERILVRYKIVSATQAGDTFELEEFVEAKSTYEGEFNLDGYSLDLRGLQGQRVNTIVALVEAIIDPELTENYIFSAGESFNLSTTFRELIPQYATGYFGQQEISYEDSIEVNLFRSIGFESADIVDFDVNLTIDNGIGSDLLLTIDKLSSSRDGEEVVLEHPIVDEVQTFGRAVNLYDPSDPVKHIQKQISFNADNSNLDALLELKPTALAYDLDLEINPLGNISLGNDFVYYGHDLSVSLDLDVPLKVGVAGLTLNDTFDVNLDSMASVDDRLQSLLFRVYLSNGYPFDAELNLLLLDENGAPLIDITPDPNTIAAAAVDGSGKVITIEDSYLEFSLTGEDLSKIGQISSLAINASLDTYNAQVIEISDGLEIGFKVLVDANVLTQ